MFKKFFAAFIVMALLTIAGYFLFWTIVIKAGSKAYEDASEPLKEYVGDTVVINKDTLIVVDYSTWNSTLELSNGTSVDVELIKKMKESK